MEHAVLDEARVVGDQQITDVVGVAEQDDVLRAQAEAGHVAVRSGGGLQESKGVAAELEEASEDGQAALHFLRRPALS